MDRWTIDISDCELINMRYITSMKKHFIEKPYATHPLKANLESFWAIDAIDANNDKAYRLIANKDKAIIDEAFETLRKKVFYENYD